MTITVAIKALNEERHIAAALESALAAVAPLGGTVVLGDCGSTDATIAIARRYPVRILTMQHPEQRSCGAGAQLAYQGVETPFFYLMDGDMRLRPDFLAPALAFLETNPRCAGVGGAVIETLIANAEFRIREAAMAHEAHRRAGWVDRLDGGGLYRTEAIHAVGYFADANLQSYEEFDLAARLGAAGWQLARIDQAAVEHTGHATSGYRLMWRRFVSGRMGGAGAVLRGALGRPHFGRVVRRLMPIPFAAVIVCWWLTLLACAVHGHPTAAAVLLALPIAFLALRRRSLGLGFYSFCQWNLTALAMLRALFAPRQDPALGVPARDVSGTGADPQPADPAPPVPAPPADRP